MEGQPASPSSKLLEEIYVRGTDTIIRVSENAVLLTTSREGGIQLPDDLERAGGLEPLVDVNRGTYENIPQINGKDKKDMDRVPAKSDRLVTNEDLKTLADNIDDDWRTLALCQLNVPATDVESIIQKTSNMRDQKFCMFRRWKTRLEQDATVKNLVSAIDQHVGKDKWGFLIGDEDGDVEDHEELKLENTPDVTVDDDEDARSTSTMDSVELAPLSLVDKDHVTAESGDVQLRENHLGDGAVGLEDPNEDEADPEHDRGGNDDQRVLEDIERLSAVYTGFAEDKKEHFTSIGASMGDIMEKILRLDHENKKLKTENKRLKDSSVKPTIDPTPDQPQTRPDNVSKSTEETQCKDNSRGKHRCEDFKKLRHNYIKIKVHLKEAVDANREWETFSRNKRDKHEKEMREKMEIIRALEEKVTQAESSSADVNRQMDSILNATENQATEITQELKRVKSENKELKNELKRLTEEKRKVEKLSRELLKGKPSRRDVRREEFPVHRGAPPTDDWQTESYREVLQMVENQARAPPEEEPRKTRSKPPTDPVQEDILFLKEQILQYRDDFERERRDREKAASELESLRKELEHTHMLLLERPGQRPYDTAGKYGGARKEKKETKSKGFQYMGPDEVEHFRSQDECY